MWTFQYKNGDRPLDGYTIQRAAGRGGFGEVYYALSDSGREVALKAVQGYEQIELRGISQCMNLKSPHLVTIFDVKFNAEGRPFVLMEFVAGPSLRQLLDESPAGLGTQKSAFFLRELGKGLTFLHECGIVHRDLKPGNVFFENGYVKIGDYGLSKAISPTQHSGQTVTVGTVHYMAPEVGAGKYDRSIDIYAMGAVLYEMLTGTVPFIGASPSEILIKHLSAEPDMSGIPEPFNTVIRKAMAKNPADRYQSIQEMVEAVFGAEHVRMSMSHFSPDDLSMVAGRVAQKITMGAPSDPNVGGFAPGGIGAGGGIGGGGSSSVVGGDDLAARLRNRMGDMRDQLQQGAERMRDARDRFRGRLTGEPMPNEAAPVMSPTDLRVDDPLAPGTRFLLAFLTVFVIAVVSLFITANNNNGGPGEPLFVFTAITGATIGILVGWRKIVMPRLQNESRGVRRLVAAATICGFTLLISGGFSLTLVDSRIQGTWAAILLPLSLMDTWNWARPTRRERVALGPALGAGLIGWVVCGFFHGEGFIAMAVLAGTALAVQVLSPWGNAVRSAPGSAGSPQTSGGQDAGGAAPMNVYGNVTVDPHQAEAMRAAGAQVYGNMYVRGADAGSPALRPLQYGSPMAQGRPVPVVGPILWLGAFVLAMTIGLILLIGVASDAIRGRDIAPAAACGWALTATAVLCFTRIFKRRYVSWWSYLVRPILIIGCVDAILASAIVMGNKYNLRNDDIMVGIFFIVFPAILLLILPFLPSRFGPPPLPRSVTGPSPHTRSMAMGLNILMICGLGGIHRFYVGKIGTGILWLLTGGLFGVGQLVDLIMICVGQFRDAEGRLLHNWDDVPGTASASSAAVAAAVPPPLPTPLASVEAGPTQTAPAAAASAPPSPIQPLSAPAWSAAAPAAWSAPIRPWRPRRSSGGLISAVAALLILVTFVVALAIGLDLPQAIVANLPDQPTAAEIRSGLFGDFPNWAVLVQKLLWSVEALLMMLAVGALLLARRNAGLKHLTRGLFALVLLASSLIFPCMNFHGQDVWPLVADALQKNQNGPAIEAFINGFQHPAPAFGAAMCVVAFILLAIPPRRLDPRVDEKGSA